MLEFVILWLTGIGIAAHAAFNTRPYSRIQAQSPRVKTTIGLRHKVEIHK